MNSVFYSLVGKFNFKLVLVLLFLLISPIKPLILLVGFAIGLDFIFGVCRSIKNKVKITSNVMSRTVIKMAVYQMVLISFYFIDKHLVGEIVQLLIDIPFILTKGICIGLIYIEILSINENIYEATGINLAKSAVTTLTGVLKFKKTIKELGE